MLDEVENMEELGGGGGKENGKNYDENEEVEVE